MIFFPGLHFLIHMFWCILPYLETKNILTSEGGRKNFKEKEQPLELFFLQKIKTNVLIWVKTMGTHFECIEIQQKVKNVTP